MNAKNKAITIKFSQSEYAELQVKAKDNNMPLASFIRERIFFDLPQIESHSFEFKVLKGISYCIGSLRGIMDIKIPAEARSKINDEISRIMLAYGLKESEIKVKKDANSR